MPISSSFSRLLVQRSYLQPLLICVAVIIVYAHTLSVPFYMDDYSSIVENPAITQQNGIASIWNYCKLRVVGYMTFSLNYRMHGLDVTGYHITNIVIHILSGLSVFMFVSALLKTPVVMQEGTAKSMTFLPLLVAIIFVLHPLQTQAVTYIVQRLAALAAFFYISSLSCFIYARLAGPHARKWLLYTGSGLLALLAFFTKQNTLTLPISMILVNTLFFSGSRKVFIRYLALLTGGLFASWTIMASLFHRNPFSFSSLASLTRETVLISRLDYFYTQIKVLWMYVGQFFWPGSLHLDHEVIISHSLQEPTVLFGLLAHILVILAAIFFARRKPLVSFAILFFYLAHSVESSFIPIRDVFFEHRTYLPNLGLCILAALTLLILIPRIFGKKIQSFLIVTLCLLLASFTWSRNLTWNDPVKLWQDSAIHAPNKARPWSQLGRHMLLKGDNVEALKIFLQVMDKSQTINETGDQAPRLDETAFVNLVLALAQKKEYKLALFVTEQVAPEKISKLNRSKLFNNKGNILLKLDRPMDAEKAYRDSLQLNGRNHMIMNNLSYTLVIQGKLDEAEEILTKIPKSSPSHGDKIKIKTKLKNILENNK